MKKLLAILAVAGFMTACNNAGTDAAANADSAAEAAKNDSIALAAKNDSIAKATVTTTDSLKAKMDATLDTLKKDAKEVKEATGKMVEAAKEEVKH